MNNCQSWLRWQPNIAKWHYQLHASNPVPRSLAVTARHGEDLGTRLARIMHSREETHVRLETRNVTLMTQLYIDPCSVSDWSNLSNNQSDTTRISVELRHV